jgi:subtilase family serine protease
MRPWKFLLPLLVSSVCFAAQPDRIAGVIDSSSKVALAGSLHVKAQPKYDQGPVAPSYQLGYMTIVTVPSPAQQKALDQLLAQQQDLKSPNYHKWLTPSQYADRFSLSPNDVAKITAWLKLEGFAVRSVGGGRNAIVFGGTAGMVLSAFGTEVHYYQVDGKNHIANSSPVMIPSALNGIVAGVMGLHNFLPHPANRFGKAALPRPNYYASHYPANFLAPGDVATNYNITPLYTASITGANQKLAVIGQTDVYQSDLTNFRTGFGLSSISCTTNGSGIITSCDTGNFQYVAVGTDPQQTYPCGDLEEADLDIEWSGAIAQEAKIIFVNSPVTYDSNCGPTNSQGVFDALTAAIDPPSGPPLAPVITMSYGICELEALGPTLDSTLQEGAAEGVTILNSSDDVGSAACDSIPSSASVPYSTGAVGGLAVSYPASSAYVTGVGGTEVSLTTDGSPTYWSTSNSSTGDSLLPGAYLPEIPWNDDEELAQFCQANSTQAFCKNGNSTPGWVVLGTTATAQQVQEDTWIAQGGGGASNCFTNTSTPTVNGICEAGVPQPAWQSGLSVNGAPAGVRWVPDVSLMASPNFPGYIFCTQLSELGDSGSGSSCASGGSAGITNAVDLSPYPSIIGGTSVSTPVFAGIIALMNQYMNGSSSAGLGLINPMLYTLAATPSNNAFHRIASGDNNVYCEKNTPSNQPLAQQCPPSGVMGYSASNSDSKTGYNLVAGLGSVNANNLAQAWKAALAPQFSISPSPTTVTLAAGEASTPITLTVTPTASSPGMTVNFSSSSCSGLPSGGTCTFSPASVNGASAQTVQLTIFVPANSAATASGQPLSITVKGTASGTSTQTQSTTVSLTVTKTTESFTISPQSASYQVVAGQAATINIAVGSSSSPSFIVSGSNTTALPLTFTCTGLPSEATGAFSPGTGQNCSGAGNISATSLTLTITTTAPTTSRLRKPYDRGSQIFYAILLPGLFGIVFAAGSRGRGARLLGLIVVLGVSTLWLGSCGGSSGSNQSNPGTPAGSYKVSVMATTGAPIGGNALTSSFTITLTVTQ